MQVLSCVTRQSWTHQYRSSSLRASACSATASERVRGRLIARHPEVDDVTVHIDPEDDELVAEGRHLPERGAATARLEQAWADIPAAAEVRRLDLHYLDGHLYVDVELPLELAPDRARIEAIEAQLRAAACADPDVADVRVRLV